MQPPMEEESSSDHTYIMHVCMYVYEHMNTEDQNDRISELIRTHDNSDHWNNNN